ncbi:MAG: type II 3-dehydroquinate dehydratase [Clostridia bacterium]|nr:type II 3-dehydroquinate dehydratase [Clostridia bacterium]
MKILVLNGPNINMLGVREPDLYGHETYQNLCEKITLFAEKEGINVEIYQSNHEGDLVDKIQEALSGTDAIVINPGGYTHTSVAILDALKAVSLPAVEVHITDVNAREEFRKVSLVRYACEKTIMGHGTDGYIEALSYLKEVHRHESHDKTV